LEIPVLVRRSARYLLVQRGFVILHILVSAAVTGLFALAWSRFFRPEAPVATPVGLASAVIFGSVLGHDRGRNSSARHLPHRPRFFPQRL
jgi:hypothetical protein